VTTALGQFIESAEINKRKTYRLRLARSMSGGDLLTLPFELTISRKMVCNLAHERETYLRPRSHQITLTGTPSASSAIANKKLSLLPAIFSAKRYNLQQTPFLRSKGMSRLGLTEQNCMCVPSRQGSFRHRQRRQKSRGREMRQGLAGVQDSSEAAVRGLPWPTSSEMRPEQMEFEREGPCSL
jgi:hypothetical protein